MKKTKDKRIIWAQYVAGFKDAINNLIWADGRSKIEIDLQTRKADHYEALVWYVEQAAKRRWTQTAINMIRLYKSLSEGRTDVLDELFPFVSQQSVAESMRELAHELRASRQQSVYQQVAAATMPAPSMQIKAVEPAQQGGSAHANFKKAMAAFEDDDD